MKISIFTPTHNVKFLYRLYESIKIQTYTNWEWVLLLNGAATVDDFPEFKFDDRIKVHYYSGSNKIGALKSAACQRCTGEVLVEVDHDDELFPTAMEEIFHAFSDPKIDFAYSNCCDVREGYVPRTFDKKFGWEFRPCKYKNYDLLEMVSFPADPRSFSKIWFCPNHFRAWRRDFYYKIGGHDVDFDIGDDHEILCRTYIHGNIKWIDKPLYVYHLHPNNTCYQQDKNDRIQSLTLELHDKYIYQIVEKWCDINKLRKIDLCGGHSKPEGYESIDLENADIIANLDEKFPFESGSVGVFRAHDALEHLKDPIHTMKEIYRCLAPNGWSLNLVPSTDGRGAFQDPTHKSFWNSNSFWYYTKHDQARFIGKPVRFQLNRIKNYFPSEYHKNHEIVYVKADLLKFSGRTPGLIEI